MRIVVVGGGLFGRIIALAAHAKGHDTTVLDPMPPAAAGLQHSGLSAAGCLMKPSWISSIPRREEGLEMLDRLIGVSQAKFQVLNKHVVMDDCWALNKPRLVHHEHFGGPIRWVEGSAMLLHRKDVQYLSAVGDGLLRTLEADQVIDCRGGWSKHCDVRWGVSFEFDVPEAEEIPPVIKPWRPFTQLVKFKIAPNLVWAGDGTAVKVLPDESLAACERRVSSFVGKAPDRRIPGMRPYSWSKQTTPCQVFPDINGQIVVTGGGKNGTIAAAWAALELMEKLDGN